MGMTKVAALISAFYCEQYLESRLENLLAQEPTPEILAVCLMGAPENRILAGYEARGVNYTVRSGIPTVYEAWNLLIPMTEADYLVVANADDLFYPGALEKMSNLLDAHPDVAVVYPNVDIVQQYKGTPVGRFELPEFDLEVMRQLCYMGPMPMWRRSLHRKYGPFDPQLLVAGDYEFWLRLAFRGEKFLHMAHVVGSYLDRPDSREHREPIRTLWETARVRSRYFKETYGPNQEDMVKSPVHDALSNPPSALGDVDSREQDRGYLQLRFT